MLNTKKTKQVYCIVLLALITCNIKKKELPLQVVSKPELINENKDAVILQKASAALFSSKAAPIQMFVVSPKSNITITAKNGFALALNTNNLCIEDGSKLSDENLQVSIQELINTDALLAANATTVSDGKILESGGSYFINISQNNKAIKIKPNKSLQIKIPKIKQSDMELFYGSKTNDGFINWQTANQKFNALITIQKAENWRD